MLVNLPCAQIKMESGSFLLDTGANVSLISRGALKDDVQIKKTTLPIRSSSGNYLPIEGHVALTLTIGEKDMLYHFWITSQKFTQYHGIIGTDILASLNAEVNCKTQKLHVKATAYRYSKNRIDHPCAKPPTFSQRPVM